MAGDAMLPTRMSPHQSPIRLSNAAVQWTCTKRGRLIVSIAVFFTFILAFTGTRHQSSTTLKYQNLSTQYLWRPHLASLPSVIHSPFKKPSSTTLQLESDEISHVPSNLKKTTPNFHLFIPAAADTDAFCKTTLSAMLLQYPTPTVMNLGKNFAYDHEWQADLLSRIYNYLNTSRFVQDDDLVLVVDGQQTWFQLPSDVIVEQYKLVSADANARLLKQYGLNEQGYQMYNQTIIFGAEKPCQNDDTACTYVPKSILPSNIYGEESASRIRDMPARFLDSKVIMGPAGDMRVMYESALQKLQDGTSQSRTVQSIFATLFAEQQLSRGATGKEKKAMDKMAEEFLAGPKRSRTPAQTEAAAGESRSQNVTRHEFAIGLDYTHTLFQPLTYCHEDEFVVTKHDKSAKLDAHLTDFLALPPALAGSKPPFWRPNLVKHNPSPNPKSAYIDNLEFAADLDELPTRKVSWSTLPLLQNTYTGSIPAVILTTNPVSDPSSVPTANVTWLDIWYSPHKRALLRSYFRASQSPMEYHDCLVGGDRAWDERGGRGGVWTAQGLEWFPWGEVDGVCGTINKLKEVFGDEKGVWLHEKEIDGEAKRIAEETEFNKSRSEGLKFLRKGRWMKAKLRKGRLWKGGFRKEKEAKGQESANGKQDEKSQQKEEEAKQ